MTARDVLLESVPEIEAPPKRLNNEEMVKKIDRIFAIRTAKRRALAARYALVAIESLRSKGFDAYIIGSLSSGSFMLHSDIDFLIEGDLSVHERGEADSLIARTMSGSMIGYDVVYAEDVRPELLEDFRHDKASPPRLLELAKEADES